MRVQSDGGAVVDDSQFVLALAGQGKALAGFGRGLGIRCRPQVGGRQQYQNELHDAAALATIQLHVTTASPHGIVRFRWDMLQPVLVQNRNRLAALAQTEKPARTVREGAAGVLRHLPALATPRHFPGALRLFEPGLAGKFWPGVSPY